jgi:hypothetical protein
LQWDEELIDLWKALRATDYSRPGKHLNCKLVENIDTNRQSELTRERAARKVADFLMDQYSDGAKILQSPKGFLSNSWGHVVLGVTDRQSRQAPITILVMLSRSKHSLRSHSP